ncbi:glycine zipper 2TM protein [Hasllibacter halocynthiae]|uniref:17 kDa surface antigen n=1 Tax=Hasllibacter halocynthiae TaxID=595589 RepID=A0A2T0X6C1_9RHOB|nr:glycine zipper 2TM domain-containing protein [Hasllibacter halocynthiae]PRY94502.1 glycine zipper 2TM protein [Hasllibacter halocynthiae]
MRKILIALPAALLLAGCETTGGVGTANQGALTGAALGAATGLAVSGDDDRAAGALVGAALGAAAGNFIGQTPSGQCVYRTQGGGSVVAACP